MTQHKSILKAFVKLGDFLRAYCNSKELENHWRTTFDDAIALSGHHNGWFTKENIHYALEGWSDLLTQEKLSKWLSNYHLEENHGKTVAIIMAGNIPLVGFHDFLCVLLTGNSVVAKLSSNDKVLLPLLAKYLGELEPLLADKISFTEEKLENFDAVIATGSNNTARYFEHYFSKKPNIIRRNRNSVAVLRGSETAEELTALGEDIFRYYGLGCRSVSKIFVPEGYNFDAFFKAIYDYNEIIKQAKYANNYDYKSYASPIASVFYETYSSSEELKIKLQEEEEKIQCIVAKGFVENEIPYGKTQRPELNDYADGVDTVDFLLKTSQI